MNGCPAAPSIVEVSISFATHVLAPYPCTLRPLPRGPLGRPIGAAAAAASAVGQAAWAAVQAASSLAFAATDRSNAEQWTGSQDVPGPATEHLT